MYKFKTYHLLRYIVFRLSKLVGTKTTQEFKPRVSLEDFEQNLLKIIEIANAHDIRVVLITRPYKLTVSLNGKRWATELARKHRISLSDVEKLVNENLLKEMKSAGCIKSWRLNVWKYNEVVREVSKRYSIPLLDARKLLEEKPQYFIDECHTNITGNQYIAQRLYELLKSKCPEYF